MRKKQEQPTLMDLIQQHERGWGNEHYPNRPDLSDILSTHVIVFWLPSNRNQEDQRPTLSLHTDLSDIERYLTQLFLRSTIDLPRRRIWKIFVGGQQVVIKSVHLEFEEVTD